MHYHDINVRVLASTPFAIEETIDRRHSCLNLLRIILPGAKWQKHSRSQKELHLAHLFPAQDVHSIHFPSSGALWLVQRPQAPELGDVAEAVEDGERLGLELPDLDPLRHLLAAATSWAADAQRHLQLHPATTAQPTDALPAAELLIQVGRPHMHAWLACRCRPSWTVAGCCSSDVGSSGVVGRFLQL